MAESSKFWEGTTDPNAGPYSSTAFSEYMRKLFTADRTTQGVVREYLNGLAVSGAASPVAVASGSALVDGTFYENDASKSIAISTPAVSTRIDRIVLRKTFADQDIVAEVITGVEGGGAPAITQNDGVIWDIKLAQVSITTGGAITVTDERTFIPDIEGQTYEGGDWSTPDTIGGAIEHLHDRVFALNVNPPEAYDDSIGRFPAKRMHLGGDETYYNFWVPDDFGAMSDCYINMIANAAGAHQWDLQTHYGVETEAYNANTESVLNETASPGNTIIYRLDVTGALTSLTAGDTVGVKISWDSGDFFLGVLVFEYTTA